MSILTIILISLLVLTLCWNPENPRVSLGLRIVLLIVYVIWMLGVLGILPVSGNIHI